jgi:hypothetical protein
MPVHSFLWLELERFAVVASPNAQLIVQVHILAQLLAIDKSQPFNGFGWQQSLDDLEGGIQNPRHLVHQNPVERTRVVVFEHIDYVAGEVHVDVAETTAGCVEY